MRSCGAENGAKTARHHSFAMRGILLCVRCIEMIRKLKTGEFRIYSRHVDPRTKKRKNLGTFATREKAKEHERAIQYFKQH
jgi:hypothetical protein